MAPSRVREQSTPNGPRAARDELPRRAASIAPRRASSTSCAGPTSCSPTRARTTSRCSRPMATSSPRRWTPHAGRVRVADRQRARAGERLRVALRLGVLPRRHRRPLFRALDHRPCRATASRSPSTTWHRHGRADRRVIRARADSFHRQPGASLPSEVAPAIAQRRTRRARLSRARHGRDDVRARVAAARAGAVRGVGPSGDERASDDRRDVHVGADGAAGGRRALPRAPRAAARPRYAIRAAGAPASADREVARTARQTRTLFLFPQSLFKLHPDNDPLVADVLAAVRRAPGRCSKDGIRRLTRAWRARLDRCARRARRRTRDRVVVLPQVAPRRLPARRCRVRRDARQRALVGRQHEPRRDRVRAARRHAAGALHARAPERGDARASRCAGARRAQTPTTTSRSRRASPPTGSGATTCPRASSAALRGLFDDHAPSTAFAAALEGF